MGAFMVDNNKINTDEYAGLGSFAAGQGQSYVDGMKGALYGAAGGLGVAGAASLASSEKVVALAQKTPLFGLLVKGKGGAIALATLASATVVSTVMSFTGFFSGVKKADMAKAQFDALKSERDIVRAQAEGFQAQLQSLNTEVSGYRKQFSDGIQSRAAQGSHAAAADADKAASAEITR
jgi:hypothetical protein